MKIAQAQIPAKPDRRLRLSLRSQHTIVTATMLLPLAFGPQVLALAAKPPGVRTVSVVLPQSIGLEFNSSPKLNQTNLVQQWVHREKIYQDTGVTYRRSYCRHRRRYRYRSPYSTYGQTVLIASQRVTPYRYGQPRTTAFFTSSTTPPAPGLRVVIRNQTIGGGSAPYTDREYETGRRSEKFFVAPEHEHQSKYLAVRPGNNVMSYQIKRGRQVVESGEFRIAIDVQNRQVTRTIVRPRRVVYLPCRRRYRRYPRYGRRRYYRGYNRHRYNRPWYRY